MMETVEEEILLPAAVQVEIISGRTFHDKIKRCIKNLSYGK